MLCKLLCESTSSPLGHALLTQRAHDSASRCAGLDTNPLLFGPHGGTLPLQTAELQPRRRCDGAAAAATSLKTRTTGPNVEIEHCDFTAGPQAAVFVHTGLWVASPPAYRWTLTCLMFAFRCFFSSRSEDFVATDKAGREIYRKKHAVIFSLRAHKLLMFANRERRRSPDMNGGMSSIMVN